MIFEVFVQAVADTFGTTLTNAGLMMGLFFSIIAVMLVAMATKRKGELNMMILSLFTTIMFTVLGWYPVWTGTVIGLGLAIVTAWYVSKITR